jgi:hypothetical protein
MSAKPIPTTDKLSPQAMPASTLAQILSKLGSAPITEAMIRDDLACGAPQNADGTINVVHYVAWLAREMSRGD